MLAGWGAPVAGLRHGTDGDPAVLRLCPGHCSCSRPVPCPAVHLSVRPCLDVWCTHSNVFWMTVTFLSSRFYWMSIRFGSLLAIGLCHAEWVAVIDMMRRPSSND